MPLGRSILKNCRANASCVNCYVTLSINLPIFHGAGYGGKCRHAVIGRYDSSSGRRKSDGIQEISAALERSQSWIAEWYDSGRNGAEFSGMLYPLFQRLRLESKKSFSVISKPRQILSIVSTLNWPPQRAVVWIVEYDIPHFFANTHRFISRACIHKQRQFSVYGKLPLSVLG